MPAPRSAFARRLLLAATLLLTTACLGKRPFELPVRSEVPRHPCADWGVSTCERACTMESDGDACLVASVAHGEGITVREDAASMQAFERQACELGVALGCEYYANNFSRSKDEAELELAREHYERACGRGRAEACAKAGSVALMLGDDGQPRDAPAALELYGQACDGDVLGACSIVGDLHTFGVGTPVDAERAAASFRKACSGGDPAGCHNAVAHGEHWLTGTVDVLLEELHAPDPVFAAGAVPSGWRGMVVTRTCFTHEAIEPVSVRIIEPSGQRPIDVVVLGTLHGWRFRARPGRAFERPVCVPNVFDVRRP